MPPVAEQMTLSCDAYSILGVLGDAVLTKDGSITLAYFLENPEPYALDEEKLDARHTSYVQAFKNMPDGTYVHKQDVFLTRKYDPNKHIKSDSYLSKAEKRHFNGSIYLEHQCIFAFTLAGLESLEKSYQSNPFSYKETLTSQDKQKLSAFIDSIEGAMAIIKNLHATHIKQLKTAELKEYIAQYVNGFPGWLGTTDLYFEDTLSYGDAGKGTYFAIADEQYLPDVLKTAIVDDTLDIANSELKMGYLDKLGVHLKHNHIINQLIYFEGSKTLKKKLENRVKTYGQYKNFSTSIKHTHEQLAAFEKEIIYEQAVLVKAHLNVFVWDKDPMELNKSKDQVKDVLKNQDVNYYMPMYDGLRNIFLGTVIGREHTLSRSYYFLTDLSAALALWINYATCKDDDQGILFQDRLFQIPLRKDLWDEQKNRIPARNAMVIAATGSGKSSVTLNIVQQFLEQGIKIIIVEFGKSFEQLTKLYPTISAHIDYDGASPLGVNPFYIQSQEELTIEKVKTLSMIVLKYWRVKDIREDTHQVVALTKIIKDYYDHIPTNHSFPDFYQYVRENIQHILTRQGIDPEYFDAKSFLHVCSEFLPGGVYENICKQNEATQDVIRDKNLIVFELTKIKKDPFLVSIIMSILFDTIESKILSDRKTKGLLVFDEYAETQGLTDTFSGNDIHSTVAFAYQKMRKENGAVMTIVQSPAQLPDNNYTKGIIGNTQILYVLPTTETVYDQIIDAFHIKRADHINLMKSIKNNFSGKHPYSEIFMRFLDNYATVVRLEFSKEKFYAFQTDGPDWQFLHDDYLITQDLTKSIEKLIQITNSHLGSQKLPEYHKEQPNQTIK